MNKYRIHRTDSRNITIQRQSLNGKRWHVISYHGNSAPSLVSGLFELIMAQYTPDDENLLKQLEKVELAIVSSVKEIRKMIDD